MKRLAPILGLLLASLGIPPAPAAAQEDVYVIRSSPAWLGIGYELRWVQTDSGCASHVLVESVVQGSPADRAGLRTGDAITAVNGDPVPPGRLRALAGDLVPGDSVNLRFRRDGATREVTAVAGRRPDRPLQVFVEERSGLYRSRAPVVEVTDGTLTVSNVSSDWDPGRTRAYWVRTDGRTEYRTLNAWSNRGLDERVQRLFECADSALAASRVHTVTTGGQVTLRQVQQRADSLRLLITRRAMERIDSIRIDTIRGVGTTGLVEELRGALRQEGEGARVGYVWSDRTAGADSTTVRFFRPGETEFSLRVEDHVAVGLRGVAGAELTALEPELADYFRNVRNGLLVLRIAPDTPADRAGLRPGDVVVAADGRRIQSVAELRRIIAQPAAAVELRVVRHGRTRDLTLRRQ